MAAAIDTSEFVKYTDIATNSRLGICKPDGSSIHMNDRGTFYLNVRNPEDVTRNVENLSLAIHHAEWTSIRLLENEAFSCINMDSSTWAFERSKELGAKALTCTFEFSRPGEPLLTIEVPLPFFGTYIKDSQGNEVQSGTILSYSELQFYKIVSYGARDYILISYINGNNLTVKYNSFSSRVMEGIIPLSDYIDSIDRMFNLYGDERTNRKSAVTPFPQKAAGTD